MKYLKNRLNYDNSLNWVTYSASAVLFGVAGYLEQAEDSSSQRWRKESRKGIEEEGINTDEMKEKTYSLDDYGDRRRSSEIEIC